MGTGSHHPAVWVVQFSGDDGTVLLLGAFPARDAALDYVLVADQDAPRIWAEEANGDLVGGEDREWEIRSVPLIQTVPTPVLDNGAKG